MAFLKCLIFIASVVYVVSAAESNTYEDVVKAKRQAYYGVPVPVPYYAALPGYPAAEDDGQYWPGKYDENEIRPTAHPAVPYYAAARPGHPAGEDDGQYWPGKYD